MLMGGLMPGKHITEVVRFISKVSECSCGHNTVWVAPKEVIFSILPIRCLH